VSLHFHKQHGAVTLIGALFIIITLTLMLAVLQRMAGSDILDTANQTGSVAALFLAESGMESAAALYSTGTCDVTLTAGSPFTFGSGTFAIDNAFTTDFTGAPLPAGDCRIRATGSVAALGAQRVIEAIFSKSSGNLLAGGNANFDDPSGPCPPTTCTPTGWTFSPLTVPNGPWDDTGGPDGSRAAHASKPNNGGSTTTAGGSFALTAFTVTAPTTLTLNFDYNVATSGPTSKEAEFSFSLSDGTITYPATPFPLERGATAGFVSYSVTINIGGTGPVTITDLNFEIFAKSGQAKTVLLDNLELLPSGGGGSVVAIRRWREVVSN
jgi:hypothetical protein